MVEHFFLTLFVAIRVQESAHADSSEERSHADALKLSALCVAPSIISSLLTGGKDSDKQREIPPGRNERRVKVGARDCVTP